MSPCHEGERVKLNAFFFMVLQLARSEKGFYGRTNYFAVGARRSFGFYL